MERSNNPSVKKPGAISRRDFMKVSGLTLVSVCVVGCEIEPGEAKQIV